ncbi:MAG: ATP synthase subunit I [Leptolyngbya foveolarum]|uniref:ATP synthase subunit I n=1 Tax=Leptolyngbya foveolarum TaxID=47253 RepID=A0A2W4URJ4_9CYAN|nr:MAG: ATP synthase subunit I [Leptolyngbya foveolarum]
MEDYYKLQQDLLQLTIAFSLVIFGFVWYFYSLNIALNYLLGACTGVVYLRMLARSVGRIGRSNPKSSSGRLAILIGVLVVATQWNQLAVLPVFLGFLTYKAALITFVLWTYALPQPGRT